MDPESWGMHMLSLDPAEIPALSGCTYHFLCSVLRTLNGSIKNKFHLYLEAERFYLVLTHNLGVREYCSCEFLWKKRWCPFSTSYQIRSLLLANGGEETSIMNSFNKK